MERPAGRSSSPLTLATNGANQTFTVTATDTFDNVGQLIVAGINIDTQAPTVTLTYSPAATPSATCTATDGLSGIGSPCQISAPTLLPSGQYQISATAIDNAGNTGSATLNHLTATADRQFIINLIAQLQ
ncbi:MAG TPA: hypothetical protein PK020_07595 [Ilumatobacteraceae bacterium]|nr:hypothetical protein [Ilumatobacteraceae bacterium]HRB03111.1 hypothetical protein [Ilumatobacteraceae bacterium]